MIRSFNFFYFDSGIDSIDILFIVSIIGMFTESGIRKRNKSIFFVKSKSIIDRNIFSCYQLIPSSSDVFVVEGFQTKPNIGKSSVCYFSFLTGEHSSARVLRVESFFHRQYYCIFAHSDLKATKQKFFDVKTF